MNRGRTWLPIAVLVSILAFIALVSVAGAQTPVSSERDSLVAEIKEYAQRHAKSNTPMQTSMIVELFRDNKAGLTAKEIAQTYEEEYERQQETQSPGLLDRFRPSGGWIVAIILFVLLVVGDVLKEWVAAFLKAQGEHLYSIVAGHPFLFRTALQHYRHALARRYLELRVPFRPHRPLKMQEIYVPLAMTGPEGKHPVEDDQAITQHRRLMVLGAPGSGKSMMLKHIAFRYAAGHPLPFGTGSVPVLLELHRFNGSEMSIEEHLAKEFERNDFPHAERFVASALETDGLALLMDGFDEVALDQRQRVVQQIKDFVQQYPGCRVVITSRTGVYHHELDEVTDALLEILQFSDQQIRRCLQPWGNDMRRSGRSIEQLMHTLRDRPRIMALVRNPLLLTMIAFLYTDTEFVLPPSRAEFYQRATDLLLDLWHQEHNRYKATDKRLILQHLALFFYESASRLGHDRRSVDYQTVLEQVRLVLPHLNLRPDEDARFVLDEIVERSGLFLAIDGGQRYQFAHLTLQEFFVASRLLDDQDALLAYYVADPDSWAEIVKLWCGLSGDSSELIEGVYHREPILAFECLADAQRVEHDLAKRILDSFRVELTKNAGESTIAAFGAVASDRRPRGAEVFEFLTRTLAEARDTRSRTAAAKALSLTNLPQAADVLARHFRDIPEVHDPLQRMGDLAVVALEAFAQEGNIDALDGLWTIGTLQAMLALIPFLWHSSLQMASAAAWRLASVPKPPDFETQLDSYALSPEQSEAETIDWIWKPFNARAGSALPVIMGRIAYLLNQSSEVPASMLTLDPRIVVPILGVEASKDLDLKQGPRMPSQGTPTELRAQVKAFGSAAFGASGSKSAYAYMVGAIPVEMAARLVYQLQTRRQATASDWGKIFRPIQYSFQSGWHRRSIMAILVALSLVGVAGLVDIARLVMPPIRTVVSYLGSKTSTIDWVLGGITLVLLVTVIMQGLLSKPPREYEQIVILNPSITYGETTGCLSTVVPLLLITACAILLILVLTR
jgi:hypothetical protein